MSRDRNDYIPDYGRVIFPDRIKQSMFRAQRGRCNYCGRTHRIRYLEIDHKQPVSRGGSNATDNLQLLCTPCNMRKGIQNDEEFRSRYRRTMAPPGIIPNPPIPQEDFTEETQMTRASREVRSIYNERFTNYRRRQYAGSSDTGCMVWAAVGFTILVIVLSALLGALA